MRNIKVNKKNLLLTITYILIVFPLLGENVFSTVFGDTISKIFSIISCFSILLVIIKNKKIHFNAFNIIMLMIIALHMLITFILAPENLIITSRNSLITPYGIIGYFMLFMLIESCINNYDKLRIIFKSMMITMTILVFANVIFTKDMQIANNLELIQEAINTGYTNSRNWLFGHRNMIFVHHLMWMLLSFMSYKLDNKSYKKMFLLQIVFTFIVGIISWNTTMLIATAIIAILCLPKTFIISKLHFKHYFTSYLILEFGIVFFRLQDKFSYIIVNLFHRDVSLTSRTYIWNYYINQFKNASLSNKLLGNYGITGLTVNSHNMLLGLLSFTGIIGTTLYICLILLSMSQLKKEKNTSTAKFVSIIIFGFLINSLTMEFYLQPLIAIYIGYRIEKFNKLINEVSINNEKNFIYN